MKEVRGKGRRLVSLALACTMVLSMFSTILSSGAAQAAEPELSPRADTASVTKPTLYIDFLGDNTSMFSGASPVITVPSTQDQSKFQEPAGPWERYDADNYDPSTQTIIFWVAVGIDKLSVFELSKEGRGLTGLELGFYYNTKYVEPYYTDSYLAELTAANLSGTPNAANQWNSNYYRITQAIPDRDIVSDSDTREFPPEGLPYAATNTWKMLYVSLEKYADLDNTATNRFSAVDNEETKYVMMLPFKLKDIDTTAAIPGVIGSGPQLCFRLVRDASTFSMGGGSFGAGIYDDPNAPSSFGAWERETRTPHHNLKEMFDFEGDLNIFTGVNETPSARDATLSAPNASFNDGNTATLSDGLRVASVNNPSPGRDTLEDVQAGLTMTLTVNKNTGTTTTTSITLTPGNSSTPVPKLTLVSTSPGQDVYTFLMPADDITVEVIYNTDPSIDTTYNAKLVLVDTDSMTANTAVLAHLDDTGAVQEQTDLTATPVKDLLDKLPQGAPMKVDVLVHPDYTATVEVTRRSDPTVKVGAVDPGLVREIGTDRWERHVTFNMPSGNVDATVTYAKRSTHYAELGVNYDGAGDSRNQATLSYRDYTNAPSGNYTDGETKSIMVNGKGANKRLENVPTGRQLTLEVTVLNDYEIDEAWLYNADDSTVPPEDLKALITAGAPVSSTTDTRTYRITVNSPVSTTAGMPDNNIQVMVRFRQSNDYNLYLRLEDAGNLAANTATLSGKDKTGVTNSVTRVGTDGTAYDSTMVYSGNTVSAAWDEASGYHVESVSVYRDRDENVLLYRYATENDLNDLKANGFKMPTGDTWVVVKFRSENYTATMTPVNSSGNPTSSGYTLSDGGTGWVEAAGVVYPLTTSPEGGTVTGKMTVLPGWRIGDHRIVGKTTGQAYAFTTFSGDGYNNGAGGVVDMTFPQPGEDVLVYLELLRGDPSPEPELSLTLNVRDDDNTTGADENWAQIVEVDGAPVTSARPIVRKTVSAPNEAASDLYKPLTAGQWVTVRVNVAPGYRLKQPTSVTISPDPPFGTVVPAWDQPDPNLFRVQIPTGSMTATVEFEKIDPNNPRPQTATLYITDSTTTGGTNTATLTNTDNAASAPANSTSTHTGTVAFTTGENFLLQVFPAPGCKAVAKVVNGGSNRTLSLSDPNWADTFQGLNGDADVFVTFVDEDEDLTDKYMLTLNAVGPDGVGDAGYADLAFGASTVGPAQSNGAPVSAMVKKGETVTLTATPQSGYSLWYISYVRNGAVTTAPVTSDGSFTMPDEALDVTVHFRTGNEPRNHTANIVLWLENAAGTATTPVNTAVVGDAGFGTAPTTPTVYSVSAASGDHMDVWGEVQDGYYISRIEITPTILGESGTYTGSFVSTDVDFTMPDADVRVNVYFKAGWVNDADLTAKLTVTDPAELPGNHAQFIDPVGVGPLTNGMSDTVTTHQSGKVKVDASFEPLYTCDTIIKDVSGTPLSPSQYRWYGNTLEVDMPINSVTIELVYHLRGEGDKHEALLHYEPSWPTAAEYAEISATIDSVVVTKTGIAPDDGCLKPLYQMERVDILIHSAIRPGLTVVSRSTGLDNVTLSTLTDNKDGTWSASFTMQDDDADIYVVFPTVEPPTEEHELVTLVATGPSGVGKTGEATLSNPSLPVTTPPTPTSATAEANPTGLKTLYAKPGDLLTIDATPESGYMVDSIILTDAKGNITTIGGSSLACSYTFPMPVDPNDGPAKVIVTFAEKPADGTLEAKLSVNDGGDSRNKAELRNYPLPAGTPVYGALSSDKRKITGLSLGDGVYIDITSMAPGYKVQISVFPAGSVTTDVTKDRSFLMPGMDVEVLVEFVDNGLDRYDISLAVTTATTPPPPSTVDPANTASLTTPLTATQGPIYTGQPSVHAQAQAGDQVVIDLSYDQTKYKAVATASGAITGSLPLSPDKTQVTFTAVNGNVDVVVTYYDKDKVPSYDVTLHLLDKDLNPIVPGAWSAAQLADFQRNMVSWGALNTDVTQTPPALTIQVPYGETVHVEAFGSTLLPAYGYVKEAYATWGSAPGTMLTAFTDGTPITLGPQDTYTPAGSGTRVSRIFDFTMQMAQADVYIVLDDVKNAPPTPEYTARLVVTGPATSPTGVTEPVGAAGSATLARSSTTAPTSVTMKSNEIPNPPGSNTITVAESETLTLTVTVNPGYKLGGVTALTLGVPLSPDTSSTDATTGVTVYTYTMPAADVDVKVDLIRDPDTELYRVTLDLTDPGSANATNVHYSVYSATKNGDNFPVPADQTVTIDLTAGADSYIKHVYVVSASGQVQKLTVVTPSGRANLQNYGSDDSVNPVNGVATFVMPAEDVTVHVVYEKDTNPPTGDLTAVVTMFDPGNTGTSTVTMSRTSPAASVTASSNGVTSSPLSVYPDEHVTIRVNPAPGYKVAKVELTGGGLPDMPLTATDLSGERYEFDMPTAPGYDVGVVVTLEQTEEDTFTATLVTVDHTSALGNTTSMKVQGTAGVGVVWAGTITDLAGNETIVTTVSPEEGVRVAAVLATDAKGTRRLSQGSTVNTYNYPMSSDTGDVTITVILDNVDAPHMHVVNVVKGTGAELTGNDVTDLTNTTNPSLPGGTLWVGSYENNVVTLDVTTAPSSYVKVTAVDSHGNTVPVTQQGLTGNVKAWLETPDDNVTVTVDWTDTPPTLQDYTLTLEVEGDAGLQASGTDAALTGGAKNLRAPNTSGTVVSNTDTTTAQEGAVLTLAEYLNGYFVQKITLISGGVELDLPVDTASLVMPSADTTVRVTFTAGEQTARPYDENQDPNTKGYTPGYLIADNPGFNHLEITVPNLYDTAMETVPDTTVFNLYYKNGGAAIRLIPGVDYDVTTGPTSYIHGGFTGQRFTIRSLKGESPLTHVTVNGGLLYITATDPVTPKAESRLVEVEVPADPYLGHHKAILKVIDSSGVSGNLAEMNVVVGTTGLSTTVTNAGTITGLLGDERVRTMAKAAPGARVSAVTATVLDSTGAPIGGSTLLGRVPDGYLSDGSQRFPFDMTGEDVLITVYFETDGLDPDDPTRYIASVEKRGAIGVPGNDATVINDARNDLLKGQIWAEGLEGNGMKVTVTTAVGYYADVTVVNKWTGAPVAPSVTGVGDGIPFDVTFDMPAADVQITVTFSTDPPKNAANKLILKVTDPYGKLGNEATLTWNGPGSPLQANGSAPTTDSTAAGEEVPVGTTIKVDTLAALITDTTTTPPTVLEDYFVKQVIVTWTDGTLSGAQAVTMSLPAGAPTGSHALEGSFLMQKGETTVEVIFEKGPRSPRPVDPAHSETYTDNTYTRPADHQKGWIGAVTLSDDPALPGKVQITVPALFDDSLPTPEERLFDAIEHYKLYWKDKSGFYHELVPGTDITISAGILLPDENTYTYTGSTGPVTQTFDAYRFEVEPIHRNSELDYYIKNGGVIYITATTADRPESDYTEVWITKAYKATLVFEPNGTSATLSEPGGRFVNTDGAVLGGLADGTTVTVKDTVADPGYTVLGVVATTVSGSVNVPVSITGEYDYTISGADVELRVVYEKDDDPLKSKGPWIVTVQKKGDDGLAGNTASVMDTSVPIPPEQKGNIWTAAYEGNVVRIDVSTEPGYHAEITAVIKGTTTEVKVAPFGSYGQLYMPRDHVDVTVEYKKGPPDPHALKLTVAGPGGPGDYTTTINPAGMTGVFISGNYDKHPVPGDGSLVPVDTELNLSTSVAGAYSVASVVMVVNGITIDIPLTDGSAWPLPKMPAADAEIIVTYVVGEQTARPYDPAHANRYTPSYTHGSAEDVSTTHQDGWILAVSSGVNKITITVPTLHEKKGGSDNLYDADDTTYKLYWRDNIGAFQPLTVGSDITISDGQAVPGAFTYGGTVYDGYKFTVTIRNPQTLWGGYTLDEYMISGGSIYITATGGGSGANESEKTEVVVPPRDGTLIATFEVVDTTTDTAGTRTHTLDDGLGHIVTDDGQQITQLRGGETMTTTVDVSALSPDAQVQSVTVTTASGGTTFVPGGNIPSTTPNAYADKMPNEDATYTLILKDKDSDRYTAAVKVVDPAGAPGNTADIENSEDPTAPTGNIWAVGHGSVDENGVPNGETMVVNFNTDISDPTVTYYANVTAVLASDGVTPVPILQLGVTGSGTAYFDMPEDNVQVTVTFTTTPPPDVPLLLTLSGHDQKAGNYAMVDWTDSASAPKSLMATGGMAPNTNDYTVPRKDGAESLDMLVTPGTSLSIITGRDSGYIVDSIKIKDELSGYELTLPMTMGSAGTLMPVILQSTPRAARITVTYKPGELTPRPYDPEHDPYYSSATPTKYAHNTDDDLSTTHQDGWLLADNLGGGSIQVTVPVLARDVEPETVIETDPDTGESKLVQKPVPEPNQYPLFDVLQEHTFDLYLYNEIADTYTRLVAGVDYDMSAGITLLPDYYTDPVGNPSAVPPVAPGTKYVGAQFTVSEVPGGKLEGLLARGGISLYITATNTDTTAEPPWFESERTELVIPSVGLVPYDPDRVNDPTKTYEDHWIRAENWGDYLTVTVPALNKTKDGPVTDVEDVNGDSHAFHFYLQPDGTDRAGDMVDVTGLIRLTNYDKFFDKTWTAPSPLDYTHQEEYKTDVFYTVPGLGTDPDRDVTGARFVLEILTDDEINALFADPTSQEASDAKAAADILRKIMDNSGTMKDAASTEDEDKRRLYITVVDDADPTNPQEGEKVDFQVPQYYTFTGELQSWAPTHTAALSIHRWDASAATPDYENEPFMTLELGLDPAVYDPALYNGHWSQSFTFKSSELAGETFKLKVRKTAHIPYDHVGLVMDPDLTANAQYKESGRNDETAKVFTLASPISLFCGDLDPIFPGPDGKIDDLDRNLLAGFLYLEYEWNTDTEADPGWDLSVFNPDSYAYAADLDGDGLITDLDMTILMYDYNFGRWQEDYGTPVGLEHVPTGYAVPFSEEAALLDLTGGEVLPTEGEEVPPEGEELPPEGEEVPPEGEELPPEGEEVPPEGEEVPPKGEELPPEGEDPAPTPEPDPDPDPEAEADPEPNPEPDLTPDPTPDPEEGEEDFSNLPQNPEDEDQNPENKG